MSRKNLASHMAVFFQETGRKVNSNQSKSGFFAFASISHNFNNPKNSTGACYFHLEGSFG